MAGYFFMIMLLFGVVSAINGAILFGIPLHYSWIMQSVFLPVVFTGVWWLQANYKESVDKLFKFLIYICLAMVVIQMLYGLKAEGFVLYDIVMDKTMGPTYKFAAATTKSIGLMKGVLPWFTFALLIYHRDKVSSTTYRFLFLFLIVGALLVGARATLVGVGVVGILQLLMRVRSVSFRVLFFGIIAITVVSGLMLNLSGFEELTNYSGRYFVPLFTSSDFYESPLGVGKGNYTTAADMGVYDVDAGFINPSLVRTHDLNPDYLFPAAESDVILFGVEYGWLFLVIFIFFISMVVVHFLIDGLKWNAERQTGAYLVIYLFSAGIFQDFFNNQISWIMYPIALSLLFSRRLRSCDYMNLKRKHKVSI